MCVWHIVAATGFIFCMCSPFSTTACMSCRSSGLCCWESNAGKMLGTALAPGGHNVTALLEKKWTKKAVKHFAVIVAIYGLVGLQREKPQKRLEHAMHQRSNSVGLIFVQIAADKYKTTHFVCMYLPLTPQLFFYNKYTIAGFHCQQSRNFFCFS
jgi:hypothetical protein